MTGRKLIPLVVVMAGLLAYSNSFTGAFVRDDGASILDNPSIRHLWPIWQCLAPLRGIPRTVQGRPLINLSLALSYALSGTNVWGYHALNLAVHILAGLTLLGIVRRTLLQPPLRERFGAAANELALATAVLWTVHPLQTESVTYIVQRTESIMGLFYLLTLYCFIRGAASDRSRLWYSLSVTACALGMASKQVMVSAPVMVLLYDRAFVSKSFREAWQRRWPLYLALSATSAVLLETMIAADSYATVSQISQAHHVTRWFYLASQPRVILYYLRLCVWPSPLCLNRPQPVVGTWTSNLLPAAVVMLLLGATVWAWRRRPTWGFLGAWFFLILAPSSSFIPLMDLMYEHRMYLSLAAVVSAVVMGLYAVVGRRSLVVCAGVAIVLGALTWRHNRDYRSELSLWTDTVAKFPNDALEHYNLGIALSKVGLVQQATREFEQTLRLDPSLAGARNNLGIALEHEGRLPEAIEQYQQAIQTAPTFADAQYNLGGALIRQGRVEEAITHFEQAVRLKPDDAVARYNLGIALVRVGRLPEAVRQYEEAVRLKPDDAEAHNNLGSALARLGRLQEAIRHWEEALRLKPDYAKAHYNLGVALEQAGRTQEAIRHWEQALQIAPDMAEAHYNLGVALEQTGKVEDAIRHYEQVLKLTPDDTKARDRLARLRAVQ